MATENMLLDNIPSYDVEEDVVDELLERYAGVPEDARPGDMLAFPRSKGYTHYALYLGNGKVMDIMTEKDAFAKRAFIRARPVSEVANGSTVYVNNHDGHGRPPLPPHEIVQRALQYENTWVEYNFLKRNCEHRSTSWRYGGDGWSTQASQPMTTPIGRAAAIAAGVTTFVMVLASGIFQASSNKKKRQQQEQIL